MSAFLFQGLTWDHPRGYRALEAAAAREHPPLLRWNRQPLEGFESHPVADLAVHHDLLVLDHPHLGDAVAAGCLQPIQTWFSSDELDSLRANTIGRALQSYHYNGQTYALPLDVAAQVMARDPALVVEPPDSWNDVLRLSETAPVALSLSGPHAVLSFFSLCLSLGADPGGDDLIDDATAYEALAHMTRITARAPAGSDRLNPIGLLEAMSRREGIALVPLIFGYVNYALAADSRNAVAFSDAPHADRQRGSVLGGTGIGITTRARPNPALVAHLKWLMSEDAQCKFIPAHDGQPAARRAWRDIRVNAAWSGFYQATAATIEEAWVRPRFAGYVVFQTQASDVLREACLSTASPRETLSRLRRLWRRAAKATTTYFQRRSD